MKKNNKEQINNRRRSLLKVFAASGISRALIGSSPLVAGILSSRHAQAMGGAPDKSLLIYVPGGGIHDKWAPSGSGDSMQLREMSSGYAPVKTDCNFLLNMHHSSAGHGVMPLIIAPGWSGDTYDVFMGKQLGPDKAFTYLNLGVHSNGQGYLTRDGNTIVPFEDNPFNAYNLIFGSTGAGNSKGPILDAHVAAVTSIQNRLAGYENERLEQHLDAIADTRRRLDELAGGTVCAAAPDATEFELTYDTFSQQARLQADIAVAALSCGLTSSVSLAFANHQGEFRIPELNYQGNYHQSIHGGSNGQPGYPFYTEMRAHLGSLSAYVIAKLRDASILDTTVVVETTDMGHADLHGSGDVPMMIAGGGAAINGGTTTSTDGNYDHRDMLHTAALAAGVGLGYGSEIPGVLA